MFPDPDVYRVLSQLQEAGLVEKIIANPEEFQAISIEECVSTLMQIRIRKTENLQSKALILVQSTKPRIENGEKHQKNEFILIPNKKTAYARAEKMLKNTEKSICFLGLTKRMSVWLNQYSPNMEEVLARKVDCRMIMPKSETITKIEGPFKELGKYPNFDIKLILETPKAGFSIWDEKEILIITSIVDTSFPAQTLWTNNKSLIDLYLDYFECLWQKAEKTRINKRH